MVVERLKIEQYLNFLDYRCRAYVVSRLKTLARGYYLASFCWNGGQAWEGRAWNHEEFPTDAELVMSLFVHFMDDAIQGKQPSQSSLPFSSQYYLPVGGKRDFLSKRIQIRQASKWPPHYQLVVDKTIHDILTVSTLIFSKF